MLLVEELRVELAQALEPEARQLPHCTRKGSGQLSQCCSPAYIDFISHSYHGEKLDITAISSRKRRHRSTRDVLISTVYDQPNELADTTLRSAPPTTIKYRQQVKSMA